MDLNQYISKNIFSREILDAKTAENQQDLINKISSLTSLQLSFKQNSVEARVLLIARIAEELKTNRVILAKMICEEVGRCYRECEAEIDKSIALVDYYVKHAPQLLAAKSIKTNASKSYISFEPLGTILAIMPWNYPIWQFLRFSIPALCAGNACLIKPAPSVVRVSTYFINKIKHKLPIDYILLSPDDVEMAIAHTQGLAFTGSVTTGKYLASLAGKHIKKSVLELGGSNAFIIFAEANLKQAAVDCCYSRFRDAGQSCNAAKRVIIENQCADEFVKYLVFEADKITLGNPLNQDVKMGPLHLENAAQKMQYYVDEAVSLGAKCLTGGRIPENPHFYPPTILDYVPTEALLLKEEVFGPVLPIVRVDSKDEAIKVANNSEFGLGAALYSEQLAHLEQYVNQLDVGSVFINRHTSSDLSLPFGGVKNSGYGRELSAYGLIEFVNIRSFWQR